MSNYNLSLQSRLPWGIQLRKNHGEKLWTPVERTKRFETNDMFIFINFIYTSTVAWGDFGRDVSYQSMNVH